MPWPLGKLVLTSRQGEPAVTMTGCVGSMDALRVVTSPKMGAVSRRPLAILQASTF